ncbi:MAG: copper transporter [Gaiellaceae bacterium]
MFDFRYHVASLAAVFVALVIGILVGVGVSSNDTLSHSERKLLNEQKAELQARYTALAGQLNALQDQQRAAAAFASVAYSTVMQDRLKGKRLGIVFVGPSDTGMRNLVEGSFSDSGGLLTRYRALKVPIDPAAIEKAIASRPALAAKYGGPAGLEKLGKELGTELVKGGKAPLWGPLSSLLVVERLGGMRGPLDGVVLVRTASPQHGPTVGFLHGFYAGLGSAGAPLVGVETSDTAVSAVPIFRQLGISSVDDLQTPAGRLALAALHAGAQPGHYGLDQTGDSAVLPPLPGA